jgi:hypothetical protein
VVAVVLVPVTLLMEPVVVVAVVEFYKFPTCL